MRKALVTRRGRALQLAAVAGLSPLFLAASAEAQTFAVSIGIRETGTSEAIGANGGTTGGIEWINLDGLTLTANNTWQQFTFNFGTDTVTAFAGATANGVLDGTRGTLEHIRIRNTSSTLNPITMFVDDMVNTVAGTPTVVSQWEATDPIPATIDTEHMFQEVNFSGSTSGSLQGTPRVNRVSAADNHTAGGAQSYELQWAWNTGDPAWLRLTTFNTPNQPNPTIDFSSGNTLSFWLKATTGAPANMYIGPSGGNWNDPANWATGDVPDTNTETANFLTSATPKTVNLDLPTTINAVVFNSTNAYTISGANTLTLAALAGFNRTLNVEAGAHTISSALEVINGPGNAANGVIISTAPAASMLTTSGSITLNNLGTLVINKTGAGRWDTSPIFATSDPLTAPVTLQVSGGEARLLAGGGLTKVNNLLIAGGATPTAKFNITNNPVVVDWVQTDPPGAGPFANIRAQVISGYAGGSWNGNGIISTDANNSTHGVGYAEASTLTSVPAIFGTVDADAVLLRLTRYGDANLDGLVNLQDFNRLAANFGTGDDWAEGDFTYDGQVTLADFNRLAGNFGLSAAGSVVTPKDWANLANAVPEPTGMALLGVASAAVLRRRRRA